MDGIKRGTKGFLCRNSESTTLSMIIAFSSRAIYGLMATSKTFSHKSVVYFIDRVFKNRETLLGGRRRPAVLVGDNARIHVAKPVLKFLKQTNLRLFTITPYSPCLNAAEHLIGAIKGKVKAILLQGK